MEQIEVRLMEKIAEALGALCDFERVPRPTPDQVAAEVKGMTDRNANDLQLPRIRALARIALSVGAISKSKSSATS